MKSPLTQTDDTRLILEYNPDKVIFLYKTWLGVDVSSNFNGVEKVKIYECNQSGYRFYYPFTLEGKGDFYEKLSTTLSQYYLDWKWEYDVAMKHIMPGSKIVDVGCGDGTFLALLKQRIQVDCHGIEFNPDAIKKATEKGITIHSKPLAEVNTLDKGGFDIATTFQVLEHIADVNKFLSEKIDLVRAGGKVIIGVPNNNPYLYRKDKYNVLNSPPHHMGLWNEKSLRSLEKYFPLKVEQIYIEPLDDLTYYLFAQLNLFKLYRALYSLKFFRFAARLNNSIFRFVSKRIKGRNIVAVYTKTR